jgi:predicted transcriptional regulator
MVAEVLEEVLSSKARLKIMDAVSVRPRTLGELADISGISVQGVLRHLGRLVGVGLVEEEGLERAAPKARRVYAAASARVRDYSTAGFVVVKSTEEPGGRARKPRGEDLERSAGELLFKRRRIREEVRKLGRMIDEAADEQEDLAAAISSLPLTPAERLIVRVVLTEDTADDGARVLRRYYGLDDRRSIERALEKARQSVGK